AVIETFRTYRNEGLFTPPSLRGTVEMPGHNGGTNWGRSAVDPTKGTMYVVSNEEPTLMRLVEPNAGRGAAPSRPDCGTGPYAGAPRGGGGRGGDAAAAGRGAGGGRGAGARGAAPAAPAAPASNAAAQPDFIHYSSPVTFMNSSCNGLELIGPP